jgi:hypothetical protein
VCVTDIKDPEEVLETTKEATNDSNERQGDVSYEADVMETLRKLDIDVDDFLHFGNGEGQSQRPKPKLDIIDDDDDDNAAHEEWQVVQCPKFTGKRVKRALDKEMAKTDIMMDDEVKRIKDVWALSKKNKWRLYRYWIQKSCEPHKQEAQRLAKASHNF